MRELVSQLLPNVQDYDSEKEDSDELQEATTLRRQIVRWQSSVVARESTMDGILKRSSRTAAAATPPVAVAEFLNSSSANVVPIKGTVGNSCDRIWERRNDRSVCWISRNKSSQ
jgi:hypothetical protein